MLTELVKALEEKKSVFEREIAAINEKKVSRISGIEQLDQDTSEKERLLELINEDSIKAYKVLWQSFTPPNPFPCPLCFLSEIYLKQVNIHVNLYL